MSEEVTPIPPHLGSEFCLWLWWASEQQGSRFDLGDLGSVELWVDDRLAFRLPADTKVTAVVTGENPSHALEARAALAGGKVLQELRLGMKRDDREYALTLRGPALDVVGLKLPQVLSESEDEVVLDRMFLYEEVMTVLSGLLRMFADVRRGSTWRDQTVPAIRRWLVGDGA